MTTKTALGIVSAVWLAATPLATAASPTPGELAEARQWAAAKFEGNRETMATDSFFSFTYDGKPSAELLKTWECKRSNRRLDDKRTEHTIAYTDPKTGLIVRVVGIEYRDFPSVEWTLYCKNAGKTDTPIIENIRSLDIRWQRGEKGEFLLHHNVGTPADGADYTPLESVLGKNAKLRLGMLADVRRTSTCRTSIWSEARTRGLSWRSAGQDNGRPILFATQIAAFSFVRVRN